MNYEYQAYDPAGAAVRDRIEAGSVGEAIEVLRARGLVVAHVTESVRDGGEHFCAGRRFRRKKGGGRLRTISMFARQLSVLLRTGTAVVPALASLERQTGDEQFREVLARVRAGIEEGQELSTAMEQCPEWFDAVAVSLVRAGESGGELEVMLDRIGMINAQRAQVRSAVLGALAYPVLLTSVSCIVLGLMIGFVLPRFSGLFETLGAPLPPTTAALMGIAEVIKAWWWIALPAVISGGAGAWWWVRRPASQPVVDRWLLGMPLVGRLLRRFNAARIARVLGVLLESHVPMLDALELTGAALSSPAYSSLIEQARQAMSQGNSISAVLRGSELIDPSVSEAMASGEMTGQMGPVLTSIANFLDEENATIVRSLSSLLEPIILIVLGVLVGFVAISMFLPLFDLTSISAGG